MKCAQSGVGFSFGTTHSDLEDTVMEGSLVLCRGMVWVTTTGDRLIVDRSHNFEIILREKSKRTMEFVA